MPSGRHNVISTGSPIIYDRFNAAQLAQASQSDTATRQELASTIASTQRVLSQATSALSRHDHNAEVDFLVQQQIPSLLASDT